MTTDFAQEAAVLYSRLASYIESIPADKRQYALSDLEKLIDDFDEVDDTTKSSMKKMLCKLVEEAS